MVPSKLFIININGMLGVSASVFAVVSASVYACKKGRTECTCACSSHRAGACPRQGLRRS